MLKSGPHLATIWPVILSASLILNSPAPPSPPVSRLCFPFLLWVGGNPLAMPPYMIHATSPSLPALSGLLPTLDRSKHSPHPTHLPLSTAWESHSTRGLPPPRVIVFHSNLLPHPTPQWAQTFLASAKYHRPIPDSCPQGVGLTFWGKWSPLKDQARSSICLWINLNLYPSLCRVHCLFLVLKAIGQQFFAPLSSPSKTLTHPWCCFSFPAFSTPLLRLSWCGLEMGPSAYHTYGGRGGGSLDLLSSLEITPSHWPSLTERSALLSSLPSPTHPKQMSHFSTDNILAESTGRLLRIQGRLSQYLWRLRFGSTLC